MTATPTDAVEHDHLTPRDAVERAFARIAADGRDGIWVTLVDRDAAIRAAREVERRVREGESLPLAGTTLAVKDNIDVRGVPTTAGCPAFAFVPDVDAPVVAALVDAGAVVVGKTNLDQFATGLVGTRSPYGACPNARWSPLIAGGSSSGSAVAVSMGMVDAALGTDTAGSGRVPAACNGIIGLKPTRGSISMAGVVPACRSLDCVSVLAPTLDRAELVARLARHTAPDPSDPWSRAPNDPPRGTPRRVGVPRTEYLDFDGDPVGPKWFAAAVDQLVTAGFDVREIDLGPFLEAGDLLYGGTFVAERYEAVGAFIAAHPDEVDPIVRDIILAGGALPAWQSFRDRTELERLRITTAVTWADVDALMVPTVPRIPTIAEVRAALIASNARLGTYTNFVNLLDLCALTVPCVGTASSVAPPFSVTFVAPAWHDERLVTIACRLSIDTLASPRTR